MEYITYLVANHYRIPLPTLEKGYTWVYNEKEKVKAFIHQSSNSANANQGGMFAPHQIPAWQRNAVSITGTPASNIGIGNIQQNNSQNTWGNNVNKDNHISGYQSRIPELNTATSFPNGAQAAHKFNLLPETERVVTEFSKIPLTDLRDLDPDLVVEAEPIYQILESVTKAVKLDEPILRNLISDKLLLTPQNASEEFWDVLSTLKDLRTNEEIITCIQLLHSDYGATNIYAWATNLLSNTVVNALKYRFGIEEIDGNPIQGFGYISDLRGSRETLTRLDCLKDMEKIINLTLRTSINNIFENLLVSKSGDSEESVDKPMVIQISSNTSILVLPWLCSYKYADKQITIPKRVGNIDSINDLFKQVFGLLSPYAIYIDVYDKALSKFRVYKNGSVTTMLCNYTVENLSF